MAAAAIMPAHGGLVPLGLIPFHFAVLLHIFTFIKMLSQLWHICKENTIFFCLDGQKVRGMWTSRPYIGWACKEVVHMISAALLLLTNSLFLSLHLAGNPGSFPKPLSAGEEQEYLARSAAGDLEARNALVEHNLRLVAHIIKKYYTQADNQEDLISIGTIGLIKAINTFRADKNIRLATYASRCIENEILMYFRAQRKLQGEVSLSDTIETDKAGNALYLMDVLGTDDTMLSDLQDKENYRRLRRVVGECLTEREADIIRRRYGLDGQAPQTQRQVAAAYHISRSYVSRIEKKALEKLEKELREYMQ